MRASHRSRRSKAAPSFKPRLDVLEDRIQPSHAVIPWEPLMPIDPMPIGPPVKAPSGVVSVSTQQLNVSRGGTVVPFTVVLNSAPTAEVDVTLAAYDPNAANDGTTVKLDHPHLAFTADNWQTPQTVDVSSPAGSTGLPDAWVQLLGTTTSTDANFDAQAVPPISLDVSDPVFVPTGGVTVSTSEFKVQQGGPSATYTIALTSQPTADVTIAISQVNPVLDPIGGGPRPIGVGMVKRLDSGPNAGPLTVTPQTLTFTADNWQTPQTVTVAAPAAGQAIFYGSVVFLDDTVTSSDPNYNGLSVAPVTVDVVANPASLVVSAKGLELTRGGDAATYTVALATQPTADVTVTIAQSSPVVMPIAIIAGRAPAGPKADDPLQISPTTLTFTADTWNQPQTVKVGPPASGAGDQFDILTQTATSADANYNNVTANVYVHLADAAAAAAGLVTSTQSLDLTAGGASVTYTIALASQPSADVTVAINQFSPVVDPPGPLMKAMMIPLGGGPTLTITPQTLTFTADNWKTPQTVTVSAPAGQVGPFGGFDVLNTTVTSNDANYNNLLTPGVMVHVHNNPAYSLVFSTDHLDLTPGASGTYTVALASQPTDTVTVNISQASGWPLPFATGNLPSPMPPINFGGDVTLTIAPATLTFTPDNWQTPQTVTVSAPASTDGTSTFTFAFERLQHAVTSNDANWNNLSVAAVTVSVTSPLPVPSPVLPIGPITINLPGLGSITLGIGDTVGGKLIQAKPPLHAAKGGKSTGTIKVPTGNHKTTTTKKTTTTHTGTTTHTPKKLKTPFSGHH